MKKKKIYYVYGGKYLGEFGVSRKLIGAFSNKKTFKRYVSIIENKVIKPILDFDFYEVNPKRKNVNQIYLLDCFLADLKDDKFFPDLNLLSTDCKNYLEFISRLKTQQYEISKEKRKITEADRKIRGNERKIKNYNAKIINAKQENEDLKRGKKTQSLKIRGMEKELKKISKSRAKLRDEGLQKD